MYLNYVFARPLCLLDPPVFAQFLRLTLEGSGQVDYNKKYTTTCLFPPFAMEGESVCGEKIQAAQNAHVEPNRPVTRRQ